MLTDRMRFQRLTFCLIALAMLCGAASATSVTKQLAPGVTLTQEINTDPASALIVNVVTVDLADPSVTLKAAIGQDVVYVAEPTKGRETISAMTARKGALVGVNADFFPFTGDPLGVCVRDGGLISEPNPSRVAFALSKNRSMFFDNLRLDAALVLPSGVNRQIDGINRDRETNQVVVYTEAFGASTQTKYQATDVVCTSPDLPIRIGKTISLTVTEVRTDSVNVPIPKGGVVLSGGGPAAAFLRANMKAGDVLTARFDVRSTGGYDWSQVEQAVGGGPWLLKNGSEAVDGQQEGFQASFCTANHPRTAVGLTADSKLLIVTVDGRQWISIGTCLSDLAALMKRLGAVNAINLDGGGSTTLSVRGLVVNSPSGGEERPVADALLVYAGQPQASEQGAITISGLTGDVLSGHGMQLSLTDVSAKPLSDDQLKNAVWGTKNGIGFVNQMGYFTPAMARKGTIGAVCGGKSVEVAVSVLPGLPSKLEVALVPDKIDPLRAILNVAACDVNGNRVPGKEVLLNITGGRSELETGATNAKGEFSTPIIWDPAATERSASVIVGAASAEAKLPTGK